jgi:signal transduction histidine kinase
MQTVTPPDTDPGPIPRSQRTPFTDELLRPFVVLIAVVVSAVQLPSHPISAPALTIGLFIPVALAALVGLLPWGALSQPYQIAVAGISMVLASVLLPLAPTTAAPAFAFLAASAAGEKLTSRRAALTIAVVGALTAMMAVWIVQSNDPAQAGWPWWLAPAVGAPVYIGLARRDRQDALRSAERAAAEASRAAASEARAATLTERSRITREIHDVLGHSLSQIALQLDLADTLHGKGREEEANLAVHRARALAVGGMSEARRAIQALREDTPPLPLPDTLRQMAAGDGTDFHVVGTPAPLPVSTAHTVIRAAQEALTNAHKHAPAAPRTMTLSFTEDVVILTVVNGPSIAPTDATGTGTGIGLVGMRERAALLDGTVYAGPDPDNPAQGGWTVRLEIPR